MRKIVRFFPYYAAAFMFFSGCSNGSASDVTTAQAEEMIKNNKDLVIIDIRTKDEFNSGHIPNAINIDYYDRNFTNEISKLDKNKKYLIYCRSGRRSGNAMDIFKDLGFNNAYNMLGGMIRWRGEVEK